MCHARHVCRMCHVYPVRNEHQVRWTCNAHPLCHVHHLCHVYHVRFMWQVCLCQVFHVCHACHVSDLCCVCVCCVRRVYHVFCVSVMVGVCVNCVQCVGCTPNMSGRTSSGPRRRRAKQRYGCASSLPGHRRHNNTQKRVLHKTFTQLRRVFFTVGPKWAMRHTKGCKTWFESELPLPSNVIFSTTVRTGGR